MKTWNFQVRNDSKEISKKLVSSFGGANKFAFNIDYGKKNFVNFKIRKRALLAFEITVQNNIIVNGKMFEKDTENETDVEISFTLHPFSKLLLYVHIILGLGLLAGIILEISNNSYMVIVGGIVLGIGVLFGLHLQKVFEIHVQDYKRLISEVLES